MTPSPALNQRQRTLLAITAVLTLALVAFIGFQAWQGARPESQPGYISRAQLGEAWPLAVEAGILSCEGGALLFRSGGVTYAVNGTAKASAAANRWQAIESISVPDPAGGTGAIKSLQPLLDRGLGLCS